MLAALCLLVVLRRRITPAKLMETNDVSGFYISVLGVLYGVVVAFMLTGVWEDYEEARATAEREANSLVNIFRLASAAEESQRHQLQELARSYARTMIEEEWSAMERGEVSARGNELIEELWQRATGNEPRTGAATAAQAQLLAELSEMTEYRRVRHLQSGSRLPAILWVVLIAGGVAMIGMSALFGVKNPRLHVLHIATLTLFVTLTLIAIADLDSPFQGAVRVPDDSFRLALKTMLHR
jgi:hypothetical protein